MTTCGSGKNVLCLGRLYCDLVFIGAPNLPVAGTETFANALCIDVGGGAFITAATLEALQRPVALMATIPAEPFGPIVRQDPLFGRIDSSLCHPAPPGVDPQVTVAMTTPGDRAFLSRRAGPALPNLCAWHFDGVDHVHIGELRSLVEHPQVIPLARKAGATISLDCGWDEDLVQIGTELEDLFRAVDVFLPNDSEVALLQNAGINPVAAPLTVVKSGTDGASLLRDGNTLRVASPSVPVVDTTGAGDAFNGGFIDAWLNGAQDQTCLEAAVASGSAAVQYPGGTGVLRLTSAERSAKPESTSEQRNQVPSLRV